MKKLKRVIVFVVVFVFVLGVGMSLTDETSNENQTEKIVKTAESVPVKKVVKTESEKRIEKIRGQFSQYDGSHYALKRLVRDNCKNPKSFKHVNTSYSDNGSYLTVQMAYRATKSFNAIVPGIVTVKVDLNGNIFDVISQD